ncbi:MAG TPA: acyltransferase [Arenibaculum sp.]|nr:acyltransferase [Arenibaculum sp.]
MTRQPDVPRFACLDALRGYAVLMVIVTHAVDRIPTVPTPVAAIAVYGWHGVQLFFIVSALTLMLSWRAQPAGPGRLYEFAVRRIFRIVPMYYAAALFYLVARPPANEPPVGHLLAQVFLVHGWTPFHMNVTPESWIMVPGSWSVAVECGFYMLFPFLMIHVTGLRRAVILLGTSLVAAAVLNAIARDAFTPLHGTVAAEQFIYYWLPNQLPVFALGLIVFYLRPLAVSERDAVVPRPSGVLSWCVIAGAGLSFCGLALYEAYGGALPRSAELDGGLMPPRHLLVALLLSAVVVVVARNPRGLLVNPVAVLFGKVSYGAYLLHFAVLDQAGRLLVALFPVPPEDYAAIGVFAVMSVLSAAATLALAWIAHVAVERPMIRLGRRVGRLRLRGMEPVKVRMPEG